VRIELSRPSFDGKHSVERALHDRHSVRGFADRGLMPSELGQLLWAAQGVSGPDGRRPAPSAGALYPLAANSAWTIEKYGEERGRRYVHMEAGHAAQNVSLQAATLSLGTTVVGAFDDAAVKRVLLLADDEEPMCLLPVGRAEG
jgi:nitroreductase